MLSDVLETVMDTLRVTSHCLLLTPGKERIIIRGNHGRQYNTSLSTF